MADWLVSYVLEKLSVLLEEKVNLFKGVKHDIEFIRDELERIIVFLRVADSMEETDGEINVWVKQVRAVSNEIEDVLDKFLLHHSPNPHNYGLFKFVGRLFLSIRNLNCRYQVAYEMQTIKSRVVAIAEGHQRYRYKFNVHKQGSSSNMNGYTANDRRGDALLLEEGDLVGIDDPKRQLVSWTLEGSSGLKVVSVLGMGGSGKTTLVKKVYDDFLVRKHFDIHAWITVSQAFKVEDVLKDMIEQLFGGVKQPLPEGISTMKTNRLKALVKDFLEKRRYVIVFDDLWSTKDWEAIKHALPHENLNSRAILTTRLVDVASYSSVETGGCVYELQPLSKDESWTLFCQKAFQGSSCPLHLLKIAENILKKCGGLPLAIVAIGGILASRNKASMDEWEMINRSLGAELEGNDRLESSVLKDSARGSPGTRLRAGLTQNAPGQT